ncbi:MAG: flagellar basal body rod protein FlgB [Buchnera aphidicola (Meitanaphis elongallis)]
MLNKLNQEFYFNECALNLRSYRQELLASNIANNDTLHHQPLDFNFSKTLEMITKRKNFKSQCELKLTSGKHISNLNSTKYNNYDKIIKSHLVTNNKEKNINIEKLKFINNSLLYQIDIAFINNKFKNIMNVLKG